MGEFAVRRRLKALFCKHHWRVLYRSGTGVKLKQCQKCLMCREEFWHRDGLETVEKFFVSSDEDLKAALTLCEHRDALNGNLTLK